MSERPANPAPAALCDELERISHWSPAKWDLIWSRSVDWLKAQQPAAGERGGGMAEPTDLALEDRRDDRKASSYYDEVRTIAARVTADLRRLDALDPVFLPKQPRQIQGKEMLDAQIAAEGWCVSCWRWNQTVKEREREKHSPFHFHDKEACDRCADFRRSHGMYPPVSLLEQWHARGRNWTSAMVAEALRQAGVVTKAKAS